MSQSTTLAGDGPGAFPLRQGRAAPAQWAGLPLDRAWAAAASAVFLLSAAYYGVCLFPGLGGEMNAGDSAKFQILGHTPILVHGPGYPFVLLIGAGLRALDLALPPWWALTFALSAIPGAVANTAAFLIVGRLTRSVVFGLAAAALLGSAGLMAVQATEAEVYALALAFILTIVYLLVLFVETKRLGFFLAACAVYAVSFGNHLMMIMLVPLFLWVTVAHHRLLLRPRPVAAVALLVLLGASQYLYLAYVAWHPDTAYSEYMPLPPAPMELIHYIMGTYFRELYGSGLSTPRTVEALGMTLRSAHPWLSAPIMAAGVALFAAGWKRRDRAWRGLAIVLGAALAFVPFTLWYGAYDIQAFHLPVLGPLFVGSMAALGWWLRGWRALFNAVAALLLAVGVVRAAQTGAVLATREPMFSGLRSAMHTIVAQAPVENPLVVMTYGIRMATLYYELQGEMPQPATYRVRWRAIDDVRGRPLVSGIVVPTDGDQFVRWIEHYRPDLRCRTEDIRQPEGARWPAYAFVCTRPAWRSSRIGADGRRPVAG